MRAGKVLASVGSSTSGSADSAITSVPPEPAAPPDELAPLLAPGVVQAARTRGKASATIQRRALTGTSGGTKGDLRAGRDAPRATGSPRRWAGSAGGGSAAGGGRGPHRPTA